ncbi:killer cell lectin-like receptor subfamily B member 1B allele C [Dendropsophus ebraccatus]|uniref:killer cell lectin-like receptor subfamily B member 1B allele C n=1 Tax=Dendropsophus ebraccatus TaxID=150705 RepID=UPI003831DB32
MESHIEYALLNLPLDSRPSQFNIPETKDEFNPTTDEVKQQKKNSWHRTIIASLLTLLIILSCVVGVLVYHMHVGKDETKNTCKASVKENCSYLALREELCIKVPNATKHQENECKLCPADWKLFQENCYFISIADQFSWKDSQAFCIEMNSHLLVIKNQEQMTFLEQVAGKENSYWIGLYFNNTIRNWTWVNLESSTDFQLPVKITPGVNQCIVKSFNYYSENCNSPQSWICQKKAIRL